MHIGVLGVLTQSSVIVPRSRVRTHLDSIGVRPEPGILGGSLRPIPRPFLPTDLGVCRRSDDPSLSVVDET
jgi:hypothetical protein